MKACAHETCPAGGAGRGPFTRNEPRPTPGLLRSVICYLILALAAVAVVAEGSAKAITASPAGVYVSAVFV